jgi:hypothetical protein
MSVGSLAQAGGQRVASLSYAYCFLFVAFVGGLAFCLIPLLPPFVAAPKRAEQLLRVGSRRRRRGLEGKCTPSAPFGELMPALGRHWHSYRFSTFVMQGELRWRRSKGWLVCRRSLFRPALT